MKRDAAVRGIYECEVYAFTGTGHDLLDSERKQIAEEMDAAFPDYDWRIAVGINKVCPECEGRQPYRFRCRGCHFVNEAGICTKDEGECPDTCPTCHGLGSVKKEEK